MGNPASRVLKTCPNVEKKRAAPGIKPSHNPKIKTYIDKELCFNVFSCLNDFRKSERMVDVLIENGEHSYPCHSIVMCARSKYFHALIASNPTITDDIRRKRMIHVKVNEIEHHVAKNLLEYMYTGCIKIPFEHIATYIESSVKWGLNEHIECHEKVSLSQYYSRRSSSSMFDAVFSCDEIKNLEICIKEFDTMFQRISTYFSMEIKQHVMLTSNFTLSSAEGKIVHCHRELLVSCSDYFRCMLATDGFKESYQLCVQLKDIDHNTLRQIIEYFYTNQVYFTATNAILVAKATGWLCPQLNIHKEASKYLVQCVNSQNCFKLEQIGRDYALHELQAAAVGIIQNNMMILMKSPSFLRLPQDVLCRYLSSDALSAFHEKEVFVAIMHWSTCNEADAVVGLVSQAVRLSLLSTSELESCLMLINRLPYLVRSLLEDKLKVMLRFACTLPIEHRLRLSREKHRDCSTETMVLINVEQSDTKLYGLYRTRQLQNSVEQFTVKRNYSAFLSKTCSRRCSVLPTMFPYSHFGCAVFDNKLFITGGRCDRRTTLLDTTYIYEAKHHKWIQGPGLNEARQYHSMVVVGDSLYVVGGSVFKDATSNFKIAKTLERIRISIKYWEKLPPLPADDRVKHSMATALGSKIFVFCLNHNPTHTSVYRYCTKQQDWLPPLTIYSPLPYTVHSVAAFEDRIYGFSSCGENYKVFPFSTMESPKWDPALGFIKAGCSAPVFHNGNLITVCESVEFGAIQSWSITVQPFKSALFQSDIDFEPIGTIMFPPANITALHTYFP